MTILRLAVGLGNPGDEYRGTRHNVGFEVIERAARDLGVRFSLLPRTRRLGQEPWPSRRRRGRGFAILEPTTFMNVSGWRSPPRATAYGIEPSSILVICDDFHLSLGRLRVRPKGSAGRPQRPSLDPRIVGNRRVPKDPHRDRRDRRPVGALRPFEIPEGGAASHRRSNRDDRGSPLPLVPRRRLRPIDELVELSARRRSTAKSSTAKSSTVERRNTNET